MKPCPWLALAALVVCAPPGAAHPAPFSYIDLRLETAAAELTVVAHVYDVAHDLGLADMQRLLDPSGLAAESERVEALLSGRLQLRMDGTALPIREWSSPEALPDRQSVRMRARIVFQRAPGVVSLSALMFPYDPAHQTFVNVYEGDALMRQAILGKSKIDIEYF